VLREFYGSFPPALAKAKETMGEFHGVGGEPAPKESCPSCQKPMRVREGKKGRFLSCTGYPACRQTRDLGGDAKPRSAGAPSDEKCRACGKPMRVREGKFGPFLSCSGYPACKAARPVPTAVACPACKAGRLAERRSKAGKTFYGCDRYPDCRFVSWDRPIAEGCPRCDAPHLLDRQFGEQRWVGCSNPRCDYRRTAPA
ncbi:MAG: topoisomerase DNA-binding C4 zinc finger domain-containing protein, partial [Myxococcales bacterium]